MLNQVHEVSAFGTDVGSQAFIPFVDCVISHRLLQPLTHVDHPATSVGSFSGSCATSDPVSTEMGDRLWTGKPSQPTRLIQPSTLRGTVK